MFSKGGKTIIAWRIFTNKDPWIDARSIDALNLHPDPIRSCLFISLQLQINQF